MWLPLAPSWIIMHLGKAALPLLLPPTFWGVTTRTLLDGWPLLLLLLLTHVFVPLLLAIVLLGQPLGRPASGPNRYEILARAPRSPSLRQLPASGPKRCGILSISPLLQQLPLQCIRGHRRCGIRLCLEERSLPLGALLPRLLMWWEGEGTTMLVGLLLPL